MFPNDCPDGGSVPKRSWRQQKSSQTITEAAETRTAVNPSSPDSSLTHRSGEAAYQRGSLPERTGEGRGCGEGLEETGSRASKDKAAHTNGAARRTKWGRAISPLGQRLRRAASRKMAVDSANVLPDGEVQGYGESGSPTASPGRKQKPDRDHQGSDREDSNPAGLETKRIETNGMGNHYAA
jgi:hypothetical protein